MASIKSELARRQRIFAEHGVNHINDYQKLFRMGKAEEPLPHLFIISDEFAELKKEQPEFMAELDSTSRIGRSLGVHLILATQKPSGVVDDQIWSNSTFRLCLKVQNAADSKEMLHTADAANITQAGRGYLQVGNNEIYELFQSAWSGAAYGTKEEQKEEDDRVYLLNALGQGEALNKDFSGTKESKQLKKSQAEEKKVFEEMKKAVTAWDEHGAQTLLLQKAIEYLKTPEVTHTRNEWQRHKDGSWEISNLVYKMTFNIVKSGDEWKLTWELSYTAPGLSQGYWGYTRSPRERIEYEGSKKYKTMEGAQKYIQSKFDQYAPCFESLSPPIPAEAKELFCVNGQLLQGYSLQPPVPQKEKVTLEDLLNCLEDGDMAVPSEAQPVSGEPAPPAEEKPQAGPPLPVQVQAQTADRGKQEPPPAKAARPAARKKPLHKKRLAMAR